MSPVAAVFFCMFLALAPATKAQTAISSGANAGTLPLRNVSVEVRQTRRNTTDDHQLDLAGVRATQENTNANVTSQVLVLNGRSARLTTAGQTPVRLFQAISMQGQWRLVPGTVWREAGSEIWVTPRWEGAPEVVLELSTRQSTPPTANGSTQMTTAGSTVVVPLDTWTTVAASDSDSYQSQSNVTGSVRRENTWRTELQVRPTLR